MDNVNELLRRRVLHRLWAWREHPGLYTFLQEYERSQFWPPERIHQLQWERLRKIVRFAYDRCPYYRRRFIEVGFLPGDLRGPEDLLKLPVLGKDDIRHCQSELTAQGVSPASYENNYTGGSTGSPISFKVSKRRWASRKAMTYRHNRWSGLDIGKIVGELWGHPTEGADTSGRERLRQALIEPAVLLNTFDVKDSSFGTFLKDVQRREVSYLLAYSRSLLLFAEYLSKQKVGSPPFKSAITTAECLTPPERSFIEQTLGCPTFDRYGCREFSVVASECEAHEGMHIAAETLLVEFVVGDRAASLGEIGEILVTDLLNEAMPFIRYKIGDLGSPLQGSCACGRGLPRMQMVAGRITDFIHTPDGRWISGVAINTYLISQIPGIRQAQIVQETCGKLRFRLIPSGENNGAAERFLRKRVPEMFGSGMAHSLEWVTEIPPEASGKTRVTISRCGLSHGFGGIGKIAMDSVSLQYTGGASR